MSNHEFKMKLYNKLSTLDVFYPKGDQVSIRCPFCGDSVKSETSAHFNIKINMSADEPVLFHCFRSDCLASGVLTPTVLRSLEINDLQLNSSLVRYNSTAMKSVKKQFGIKDNSFELKIPEITTDNELLQRKRDYINRRLGINLSYEAWTKLKIVFNFPHFLRYNGIDKLTKSKYAAQILQDNYVGFLSTRNEFINFRVIDDTNPKLLRYDKYSIYAEIDNTRKFYTIPGEIDLLTNDPIHINIAEGSFDILGVYFHVKNKETRNQIYVAVNGASYSSVIKYFIQMGVVGNVIVNVYSDDNMDIGAYSRMVDELGPWVKEFHFFYNEIKTKGKADFGVPAYQIKVKEVKYDKQKRKRYKRR